MYTTFVFYRLTFLVEILRQLHSFFQYKYGQHFFHAMEFHVYYAFINFFLDVIVMSMTFNI